jgi:hypothetical protein
MLATIWKTSRPTLAKIFSSRKALATIAGAIVWGLTQFGFVTTPDKVLPLLALIGFYLLGQGLADFKKEAVVELGKNSPE